MPRGTGKRSAAKPAQKSRSSPGGGQRSLLDFGTQTVGVDILRADANGRVLTEPPESAPESPGWRNPTSGRYIGYELSDPNARRNARTGAFVSFGEPEKLSLREQRARYGDPDGEGSGATGRRAAMLDALYRHDRMSETDEIAAQARAADVSLSPREAKTDRPEGAVGRSALGGFDPHRGGERSPHGNLPLDERPPDLKRGEDPFAEALPEFESTKGTTMFPDSNGILPEDDVEVLEDQFETAVDAFDEFDESDRGMFFERAAEEKDSFGALLDSDGLAVATTNRILNDRRSGGG